MGVFQGLKCFWGFGEFEDVKNTVSEFLEKRGYRVKVVESGRFVEYKSRFKTLLSLVYYYSDHSFRICGKDKVVEELKEYIRVYARDLRLQEAIPVVSEKGIIDPVDRINDLLRKRDELIKKYRYSRATIYLIFFGVLIITAIGLIAQASLEKIVGVVTVFVLVMLFMPMMSRFIEVHYVPIFYHRYKREIAEVEEEIKKLIPYLPRDHPLRDKVKVELKQ